MPNAIAAPATLMPIGATERPNRALDAAALDRGEEASQARNGVAAPVSSAASTQDRPPQRVSAAEEVATDAPRDRIDVYA